VDHGIETDTDSGGNIDEDDKQKEACSSQERGQMITK
jgi:hypothetical protein